MISKQIYHVQALGTNETFNINGFLTGIIDINFQESSRRSLNIYGDVSTPVGTIRPPVTVNGVLQDSVAIILETVGTYRILIDLTNVKYLKITADSMPSSVANICFIPDASNLDEIADGRAVGGHSFIYDVRCKKQIDFHIDQIYQSSSGTRYARLYQSEDGNTWTNFTSAAADYFGVTVGGYAPFSTKSLDLYANVESINYLKLKVGEDSKDIYRVKAALYDEYAEGRSFVLTVLGNNSNNMSTMNTLLKGYRYVKVEPLDATLSNGYGTLFMLPDVMIDFPSLLNGKYEAIRTSYNAYSNGVASTDRTRLSIMLLGNANGGSVVIDFKEPLTSGIRFYFSSSSGSNCVYGSYKLTLTNNIPETEPDRIIADKNDYVIKEARLSNPFAKRDAFGGDVIEYTDSEIVYYQYGYDGLSWKLPFGSDTVESFITGETIKYAYLIPFNGTSAVGTLRRPNRIIVFTNKNRILHNISTLYNFSYFVESKVVNPYKKWQAVNDANAVDSVHRYFPILKDYDYDQFENRGALVTQGTAAGSLLLDFQTPEDGWVRTTWCNLSRSNKAAVFGNYNNGKNEPVVVATVDGGRTWKVVAWFGFVTDYNGDAGNRIDLTPISSQLAYTANSLKLCIREYRVPTAETPEPTETFIIDTEKQVNVSSFSTDSDGNTFVHLSTEMDFGDYCPVCYFVNNGSSNIWDTICNNNMDESGTNSNGIFFRLRKVSRSMYKLTYNIGNPYETDLLCYHVHCVNRTSAGFVISTGESYYSNRYEGGMLYFLTMNYNNGANAIPGGVDSLLNKTIRLTSSPMGVNRACGAYICNDNQDPTVIYVSDESFYTNGKRNASIPNRTVTLENVPTGIFSGKLSDIDDQAKYECVCETRGTVLSLFEWNGHFIADGHYESVCISKDGKTWSIETNADSNKINGADPDGNIYFGDYKVEFK